MKRFTLMVNFLTLLCLSIEAQNFKLYENKQIFSNMFTEEEYRTSTSVAPLCTSELSWNVAKRVYSSGYTLKNLQTTSPLYLLVVEDKLYPYIRSNIYDYAQLVSVKMEYDIEIVTVNNRGSAQELRKKLLDLRPRLIGCFFIGDVPYAQYQIENEDNSGVNSTFPCDLYFMDLDGTWLDNCSNPGSEGRFTLGADGIFDWHVGSVAPDIFIGRLPYYYSLDNRPFEQLVNQYLERLIRYWEQPDGVKKNALTYINPDWAKSLKIAEKHISMLSHLGIAGYTIDAYDSYHYGNKINAEDYMRRIASNSYSFVHLWAHSTWTHHIFDLGEETKKHLHQNDIYRSKNTPMMYNLFCCSATRWTEKSYLGGAYLFGPKSNTLALVGSTKVGSMYRAIALEMQMGQG